MKDIEKLFKDKLQHHREAPPEESWEKLQELWNDNRKPKRRIGWWLAASISVVAMLSGLFYQTGHHMGQQSSDRIAIEISNISRSTPYEKVVPKEVDMVKPPRPNQTLDLATNGLVEVASAPSSVNKMPDTENAYSVKQLPVVERIEVDYQEKHDYLATSDPAQLPLPTLAHAPTSTKPSVTIIYKSGETETSVKKISGSVNPLEKAVSFLANIKENGVGFSELRSAKSELFSKAFSNDREETPAE